MKTFDEGFLSGLMAAVILGRAGATMDDLAVVLPVDPAVEDPAGYRA